MATASLSGTPPRRTPAPLRRPPLWSIPLLWTLALGLWGLSRQHSLWRDEAATWQVARRSTADIWHMLAQVDAVHGLYYLLMHGLFERFGPGIATLRLPSVLAMAVAAACVTVIGRRLAGAWAGLAGGLAFGMLPAVQFYLQEGRPYALVAAGAGVSTLLLVTVLQGRGRAVHWVAYGATVAVCGLLNWLSLLILPAHLVTLLWTRARRGTWTRWAAVATAAVVAVLPLILFSRSQSHQVSWIPPLTWHTLIGPAILLAIGGLGALLDRPRAGRLSVTAVGLPLLAVPQLGLLGLCLVRPLYLDRYILFSMLGLSLLIGTALATAVRAAGPRFPRATPWLVPVVVAVAVVALLPQSLAKRSPASRVDDVLAVAEDVRRLKGTGDAVLFVPAARRDTALVSPGAFAGLRDIALAKSPVASGTLKGEEAAPARIRTAMLAHRRILLVTDAPAVARPASAERDKMKAAVLREYFTVVADEQVRGRRVTVYERL
ncbi:glycosyltransferase family 39 protein [Streptomyces viridochromogenes]|uniref:Putative integral membrane protein n=1 Tax=Streptomyces viridochromogenes Tue57 TaxID=1160705 RepID=L8PLV6_STRVR|nr:glycosyltransferase family 39 protein [Streptomyces viridochromogenes]ELS56362.1 putative integral membrane protein [Streptomyces viridochromogenes Tue57]